MKVDLFLLVLYRLWGFKKMTFLGILTIEASVSFTPSVVKICPL